MLVMSDNACTKLGAVLAAICIFSAAFQYITMRLFEGVEVTEYRHVTGWGGGRELLASWSDPWNASANRLCTLAPNAPSSERCPRQCSAQPRHLRSRRLRKAIGKMSDREWRKVVDALVATGVPFVTFDILSDEDVRQGLKAFSNWPTYPQLYHKGELLGGCDIVLEMAESGEMKEALAA